MSELTRSEGGAWVIPPHFLKSEDLSTEERQGQLDEHLRALERQREKIEQTGLQIILQNLSSRPRVYELQKEKDNG